MRNTAIAAPTTAPARALFEMLPGVEVEVGVGTTSDLEERGDETAVADGPIIDGGVAFERADGVGRLKGVVAKIEMGEAKLL